MDISKYMVTALLITTIFSDMNEPIIFSMVAILSIVVLVIGLILVNKESETPNKKKGNKK